MQVGMCPTAPPPWPGRARCCAPAVPHSSARPTTAATPRRAVLSLPRRLAVGAALRLGLVAQRPAVVQQPPRAPLTDEQRLVAPPQQPHPIPARPVRDGLPLLLRGERPAPHVAPHMRSGVASRRPRSRA